MISANQVRSMSSARRKAEEMERKSRTIIEKPVNSAPAAAAYLKPFDLADEADTSFSILDNEGRSAFARILNVKKTVVASASGSPLFTFGGVDRWTSGAVSGTVYVYLRIERATASIYLEAAGTPAPDGDDDTQYVSLWKLPWDAVNSRIDWDSVVELRFGLDVPGMV